tara:strand:- start:120 stop:221 length:102 start_codon:yes stop_codon:yes gene_type:complete
MDNYYLDTIASTDKHIDEASLKVGIGTNPAMIQ